MKLNKPKVSENQTELETYVESLLKDNVDLINTDDSKVTPLRSKKITSKEFISENRAAGSGKVKKQLNKDKAIESSSAKDLLVADASVKSAINDQAKPVEKTNSEESKASQSKDSETQKSNIILPSSFEEANSLTLKVTPKASNKDIEPKVSNSSSTRSDSTEKHHQKITEEFEAYQNSAHTSLPEQDPRLKNVEKLLNRIALASAVVSPPQETLQGSTESKSSTDTQVKVVEQDAQAVSAEVAQASFVHREAKPMKELLGEVFQTLVFEVHKLPLAVPLVKLGGIVNFSQEDLTPLVGTPEWFLGLVPNERGNLMVVDTQKFLMPEKIPTVESEYQYLIVLDNSNWALACHAVNDAKNLSPDDIRWSARSSKRPWFAGMVVEYMSALVEVDELINLLAENVVE